MGRSLRTQLTAGGVVLAALAIAITAAVVARTTSADLVGDLEERLEDQAEIVATLTEHAVLTGSWDGVSGVVADMAEQLDLRIALTTTSGDVLADSDPDGQPLAAASVIDPGNPLLDSTISDESLESIDRLNVLVVDCLDAAGVPSFISEGEFGFPEVIVGPVSDADSEFAFDAENRCYESAYTILESEGDFGGFFDDLVAEPAVLFLGASDGPAVDWIVVSLTALAVLAAMAGLVWWLTRRFTAPLLGLAAAARRVRSGDLSARVDTDESGEIGELASSFNEMAGELEGAADRRRRFTSDVAHELRTPLANITSHVEALLDGVEEPTPDVLAVVRGEVDHVTTLVDDLQQLTLVDEGRLKIDRFEVVLDDVVDQVVEANRIRAADAGVVLVHTGEAPDPIEIDPIRIRQALDNLVSNAIRHTPVDGAVTVAVVQTSAETVVAVRDTGPGIPEEFLPQIFQRFARADAARSRETGGSGLGLAIAHELARAHGASLEARNLTAGGAEFTIRFVTDSGR